MKTQPESALGAIKACQIKIDAGLIPEWCRIDTDLCIIPFRSACFPRDGVYAFHSDMVKKVLQSSVLVLLLLAISSNLLASSYSRTAGDSWDEVVPDIIINNYNKKELA